MKIGFVTYSGIDDLKEWEHGLFTRLKSEYRDTFISIIQLKERRSFSNKSLWKNLIIRNQLKLEKKLIDVRNNFKFIPDSHINATNVDQHKTPDSNLINLLRNQDLDVVINLSDNEDIALLLSSYSKNGVLQFVYRGESLFRCYNIIGVRELLNKEPTIKIELVQYSKDYHMPLVVDYACYNIHWSSYKNYVFILCSLDSLIVRNLIKERINGTCDKKEKNADSVSVGDFFVYYYNFYGNILKKYISQTFNKLFKYHREKWSVYIGKNNIFDESLDSIIPIRSPKNEFWADPFLYKWGNELYLFFERYPFKNLKGRISCAKIFNGRAHEVKDVLIRDYHLSYPFIFEECGNIFMIPETSENMRLEVYKCTKFPDKWELYSTAFEGESLADSVYFVDEDDQKWFFTNKSNNRFRDHCTELYIYKIDSLGFNSIKHHKQNPVIINSSTARNGGGFFVKNNNLYRVSQNNSYGIYGYSVWINQVKTLSLEEYIEIPVKEIKPTFDKGLVGVHHMHQIEDFFVIDGCSKQ